MDRKDDYLMYPKYGSVKTDWPNLAARTMINREPNMNPKGQWAYEDGLMLNGMYAIYKSTGNVRYLQYIQDNLDRFITDQGQIKGYHYGEFSLDQINNGKAILDLYEETHQNKYKIAATTLYKQLLNQPRTAGGIFWHKKMYPYQVWLDGLYMGAVFYARYQKLFGIQDRLDDVMAQFLGAYQVTHDDKTGLCYHAYDEKHQQSWANKDTGHSPHFWTRSIGWFVMAMVDVLEYLPEISPERAQILDNLKVLLDALRKVAEPITCLWYQITDEGERPMNYLESSGSFMILNALAKALRKGYLSETDWGDFLDEAYPNALKQFVSTDQHQNVNVNKVVYTCGLGGARNRMDLLLITSANRLL
ncbi:glycoside hydrolase family 88/105 protein [Agrilactobacillus composti]|uniref:glycoside hydrolase family 88/105 protein n=1 Tax=Agrilactobacillus composti TaxID=398555 RepID=UPI00190F6791|nr:glycoside hydrolase family 88 protein [Agrilactobacillus composti]